MKKKPQSKKRLTPWIPQKGKRMIHGFSDPLPEVIRSMKTSATVDELFYNRPQKFAVMNESMSYCLRKPPFIQQVDLDEGRFSCIRGDTAEKQKMKKSVMPASLEQKRCCF
ncbi:hypothetical protein LLE49_21980 [Alicyclobacillus tolerans]|uniref:hypothetical protein n=1 Tax=Alicyclobacillus tolerans TaxID=90970 RepID=UPI001F267A32|nr:hypothetical protein [Alicyclobacillus tolerans]MCF8567395.1 hypothetical protein [Alicyclobacillus tolerans]